MNDDTAGGGLAGTGPGTWISLRDAVRAALLHLPGPPEEEGRERVARPAVGRPGKIERAAGNESRQPRGERLPAAYRHARALGGARR